MKILFICEEYPPGRNGGIGTMVKTLGRELVRQGHSVYVAGLYPHGYGQKDYEEDHGVKVWRLRYVTDKGLFNSNAGTFKDKTIFRLLKYSLLLQLDTLYSVRKMFRFISDLVQQEQIDIIECPDWNTFFQNSFATISFPRLSVPLVIKFNGSHSYFQQELGLPVKQYVYRSEKKLLTTATALCSVSRYTAQKTAALFGLDRPIKILYNCINLPEQPTVTRSNKKIIFTGTLTYKKGIFSLLKAWNEVYASHPDATLDIYGKGDTAALEVLLTPAARSSVHFKGHVSQEVLFSELSAATAAVFPSYSECFALAPLEAMAVGCAVINTSRSSGHELVTDKENGLLIDPDDIQGIADAIKLLLTDDTLRKKIADNGKRTIEQQFNITTSVRDHIQYYNEVIKTMRHVT